METPDDLLQFKDYTSAQSSAITNSGQPAQISVNTLSESNTNGRQRGDPLSNLVYEINNPMPGGKMTTISIENDNSKNVLHNKTNTENDNSSFDNTTTSKKKLTFLSMEYYQQFFNVDTYMVLERIANSIIPRRASINYLRSYIEVNADLYGPFWITVTLIFSIAISGNIASYLQYAKDDYQWRYNFHLVSYAATCIFIYVNVVPVVLWFLFKYSLKPIQEGMETESADYTPSLLTLICIYGYSLSIYIPVSILWVIQVSILQWLLVITAALLSGSVLICNMTPALRNSKISLFLVFGILGAHFLLAAGFMLYFFHVPSDDYNGAHYSNSVSTPQIHEKITEIIPNIKTLVSSSSSSSSLSSGLVKNIGTPHIVSK